MKKLTQNVNKDKLLNDLPKVTPQLSKWLSKHTNYISSNIGQIIPIYVKEVLPKEKKKVTTSMISHTVTPVAPIFPSMYTEIRSFFVPYRLCADLLNGYKSRKSPFVKVFGEDPSSESATIVVPLEQQCLPDFTDDHYFIKDITAYLEDESTTNNIFNALDYDISADNVAISLCDFNFLELAAYELIYQRHYRNENYESSTESPLYKLLFDAYNVSKLTSDFPSTFTYEIANREKDYFTGMKPFTQKGDPVEVSLGDKANIKADNISDATKLYDLGNPLEFGRSDVGGTEFIGKGYLSGTNTKGIVVGTDTYSASDVTHAGISKTNLYVDLKSAKGIAIEDLRLLIKTQELLEKDAMYGSRYAESLNSHFGTAPLDLTLQDPQELYKVTITSNMQAIFQTSSTSGEDSILGTIGANSTTQTDPFVILPETEFKEHGILMICAVHKLQNVYDSFYFKPKMRFKKYRFDWYTPELNDLGFQEVSDKEMRTVSGRAGFNEAFAEYRYDFNKVHGELANSFPYWAPAISNEYASASTLYKEDPTILDKALSVRSASAPQFYDAWGFLEEETKPMSLHSIPGMDGVI